MHKKKFPAKKGRLLQLRGGSRLFELPPTSLRWLLLLRSRMGKNFGRQVSSSALFSRGGCFRSSGNGHLGNMGLVLPWGSWWCGFTSQCFLEASLLPSNKAVRQAAFTLYVETKPQLILGCIFTLPDRKNMSCLWPGVWALTSEKEFWVGYFGPTTHAIHI